MRVWKSRPKDTEVEEREYRCPACRRRIVTVETVRDRLGPVRIK
jgi:DNA-directed RNA polymerase subunit RPC12/RpoP